MWKPSTNFKYGVAVFHFRPSFPGGLPLNVGETVHILEECTGWCLGCYIRNKEIKGIFPASHVEPKSFAVDNEGPYESVTPVEDPTVKEVSDTLREWNVICKQLYLERKELFSVIKSVMLDLMQLRRSLMSGTLTHEAMKEAKGKATAKMDWGNFKLGLDLVPRVEGREQVDPDTISAVKLFHVHLSSAGNSQNASLGGSFRQKQPCLPHQIFHLHLLFKNFGCPVGEETEVYFSLYDAKEGKSISERFLAKLAKNGLPTNLDRLHHYSALFTDLGSVDRSRDLYLVTSIYRLGRLRLEETPKKMPTTVYRRPYGCGVLSIRSFLANNWADEDAEDKEVTMKIIACNENDFSNLIENLIKKQNTKFSLSSGQSSYSIVIGLQVVRGELDTVRQERPMLFAKGVSICRKLGFGDIIMPGDVRNDLYVTLDRGKFEKGSKKSSKNVEIKVKVLDSEGQQINNCIVNGGGEAPITEFNSSVFYHSNSPKWNETIKLAVPIQKFYGSHFRLEFRHCSRNKAEKKLFAFGFVKLMASDGTTVRNRSHELYLYKCEDISKIKSVDYYIGLPSTAADVNPETGSTQGNTFFHKSNDETIWIDTLVCSTKLTQNVDLLGLLKWRAQPEKIEENLRKLMKLDGAEIVKFLQDILDALFSMFSIENGNNVPRKLVFQALVFIFCLLEDEKFKHFKPVMDMYITGHFSASLVYRDLITCLKVKVDQVSTSDRQVELRGMFTVLHYILKFIVQSRVLFSRATGGQNEEEFLTLTNDLVDSFHKVIALNFEIITKTQVVILENLTSSCTVLLEVLPATRVSEIIATSISKVPKDHALELGKVKLASIRTAVNSTLFTHSDCRSILVPVCLSQLKRYMIQKQNMKLCSDLLGDLLIVLHQLQQNKDDSIHEHLQQVVMAMLDIVLQSVITIDRRVSAAGQLVACLVCMLKMMTEVHYRAVLDSYRDRKPLKDFLLRVFTVFRELVQQHVFPKDWMVMRLVTNHVILTAIQFFSQALNEHFRNGEDFDNQVWSSFFSLAVAFLTQPSLQLETFSSSKRDKIRERYLDMRVIIGHEILTMWQNLGHHKIHFIPGMVEPFLNVTLVPEKELRMATLPIFFDMMECEQNARGNFKQVECELIEKLDVLVNSNKGDDEYRELFNTILINKVQQQSPVLQENSTIFIKSVSRLLERLLDYRNVLEGEENQDKRMTCTVNLLNFYEKEIRRQEMYIRYVNKLCDLHLEAKNYREAAFTLQLHASLLKWSDKMLTADCRCPDQMEWQRKEFLYQEIIKYFHMGKSWENGIPLCKELANLYELKLFDYDKLSMILQKQAQFFENIKKRVWLDPMYFRVGFFGMNFPPFLRNKCFIYRGDDLEKLGSFQQRLMTEFPAAEVLSNNSPPNDSVLNAGVQRIQICNVKPVPSVQEALEGLSVPPYVSNFYKVNDVDTFQLDRPFHEGDRDKTNEFKTLCLERTLLQTACKLPGILRWFEVIHTEVQVLSPIETAIDMMEHKNQDMRHMVTVYSTSIDPDIRPFTMKLNGIIDPSVNGGIKNYQEAFLTEEFAMKNPQQSDNIARLKAIFLEQVPLLEGAISLHSRLASSEMLPLHKRIVECFSKMKREIRQISSPNLSRYSNGSRRSEGSDPGADIRPSTPSSTSSKSISPCYTPTPPSSNRSSGIYVDTDIQEENIYEPPREPSTLTSSGLDTSSSNPKQDRTCSDPNLNVKMGTSPEKCISSAVSSVSLDTGLTKLRKDGSPGPCGTLDNKPSTQHYNTPTNSLPLSLPPRSMSESQPSDVKPPLPERTMKPQRSKSMSMAVPVQRPEVTTLPDRSISEESDDTPPPIVPRQPPPVPPKATRSLSESQSPSPNVPPPIPRRQSMTNRPAVPRTRRVTNE